MKAESTAWRAQVIGNRALIRLLTGGEDMSVNILNKEMRRLCTFNAFEHLNGPLDGQIHAIGIDEARNNFVIGLYSGEIYQVSYSSLDENLSTTEVLIQSCHYAPNPASRTEIGGLCTYPSIEYESFMTCSFDGTLRLWDADQRVCIATMDLNIDKNGTMLEKDPKTGDLQPCGQLTCVDISQDLQYFVVGTKDGTLRLIRDPSTDEETKDWVQVLCVKQKNSAINDLKISPNGQMLAVAYEDSSIGIFAFPSCKLMHFFNKHSTSVLNLDWSLDSAFIHSVCSSHHLLYFSIGSGDSIPDGSLTQRDERWATMTTKLGWPVKGVYRSGVEEIDVTSVDRSNYGQGTNTELLAVGGESKKVQVYKYPCLNGAAKSVVGQGHSSDVLRVKFAASDKFVYSTGGEDLSIMQWKIVAK